MRLRSRTPALLPKDRTWTGPLGLVRPYWLSYEEAIKGALPRPIPTPTRTVTFTDQASFQNALNNMQAGDLIKNVQPGGFDITSASSGFNITGKNPSSMVWIDLGMGVDAVRFSYTGTSAFSAFYMDTCSNLTFFGGKFTNPNGGKGILTHGSMSNVSFYDFVVHDCADSGIGNYTVIGDITGGVWRGEIYNTALVHSVDTHPEKGTGQHCMNHADGGGSHTYSNVKIGLYAHDHNGGSVCEFGDTGGVVSGVEVWIKAENLTMAAGPPDAVIQVAGNGINLWGSSVTTHSGTVHLIQVKNAQGRVLERSGRSSATCAAWTIEHGRAVKCVQNQSGMIAGGLTSTTNAYDPTGTGPPIYDDCRQA